MLLLMMNQRQKQRIIKISIYTLLCISFLWWSKVFAEDYVDKLNGLIAPINDLIEYKDTDRSLFTEVIDAFCNNMTAGKPMLYGSSWGKLAYNAKNSLFMYRLCNDGDKDLSISRGFGLSDKKETSYVNFLDTNNGSTDVLKNQLPSPFTSTNLYIENLFDTIVQSYTSIYQAGIYGKKGDSTTPKEKLIDNFSKTYFTGSNYISICAKDKTYKYPQTCKKLTSYLDDATNSLNSSENILNPGTIYKDKEKAICDINNETYNTIRCGLYDDDMTKFVNLVYNELFFYTSFVQYYTYILETQPQFRANANLNTIEQTQTKENEVWLMRENLSDSRKAVTTSIRFLKELQMTFPMHIGLLMYTEAINTFVQSFNQTLVPIYTLWDIFRNVQDTK